MSSSKQSDYTIRQEFESGVCGVVYYVKGSSDDFFIVKEYDALAVNRGLLEDSYKRLENGGWPEGVVQIHEFDFESRPKRSVMQLHADLSNEGKAKPRSLQNQIGQYPNKDSWKVVIGLVDALASLHNRQVVHGNLKPGNVFLNDAERVELSDWGLGNMPGIASIDFSDALLYQPPEQLRNPDGYYSEDGYRWDVYAFGSLAYRILTGEFPRCDKTYQQVAPKEGHVRNVDVSADPLRMADALEGDLEIKWQDGTKDPLIKRYRKIIESCLELDPLKRPANALELKNLFDAAKYAVDEEKKLKAAVSKKRWALSFAGIMIIVAAGLTVALLSMTSQWETKVAELAAEKKGRLEDVSDLNSRLRTAKEDREEALSGEQVAKDTLANEREEWLSRINESRKVGDKLFAWAMEADRRKLPPLDGRSERLEKLESFYEGFIENTDGIAELKTERARARFQLAEISLALGQPDKAAERLEVALQDSELLKEDPGYQLRLATDRLILAILLHENNSPVSAQAFQDARDLLEAIKKDDSLNDRLAHLLAVLDFNESAILAKQGKEAEALDSLYRATESLNRLSDNHPGVTPLRSEMVSCYLSSARILDNMGEMGDARTIRRMAADELLKLIKKKPDDLELRLKLAGCYGSIAEAALIAGDVASAEAMSKGATQILAELLPQRPDSSVIRSRLAAQRGLTAGILRDRGESDEAMKRYDEGLQLLRSLTLNGKADPIAKYRYALLNWEKGRMIGFEGDRVKEIENEKQSVEMLDDLLSSPYGKAHEEQLQRSLGYLLGDLGHAAQVTEDVELAKKSFARAVDVWAELNKNRPGREEYEEALLWNKQRMKALK